MTEGVQRLKEHKKKGARTLTSRAKTKGNCIQSNLGRESRTCLFFIFTLDAFNMNKSNTSAERWTCEITSVCATGRLVLHLVRHVPKDLVTVGIVVRRGW